MTISIFAREYCQMYSGTSYSLWLFTHKHIPKLKIIRTFEKILIPLRYQLFVANRNCSFLFVNGISRMVV